VSKKRLVIHVGFHKSGTTALQESFHSNIKLLLEHDIKYPNIGARAHHRMAWALTQRSWGWGKRGGEKIPPKYWDKKVKTLSSAKESTIVLSSEFFSELDGEKIRKIRSDFRDWEIRILFTLRPLAKLLPSTYQQYLKYGTVAEYEDWLHSILDIPGESKINPSFWKRHSHGKVIARWVDIFGPSSVSVLIVNESQPTFLFDAINDFLGLPKGTLASTETGSNRSLTMEEIALLLELNRIFPKSRNWDEYQVFIRNGYIRELTDHISPSADSARLLTPTWAIEKANEIGGQIRDEIRSLGVTVIGDSSSLGSATVPSGHSKYPDQINIKTVAAAMLAFDRETVASFPADWLQQNLFKRFKKQLKVKLKNLI
jgi:hypothetical protein